MSTTVEAKAHDGQVTLTMKASTAAALVMGLTAMADMPHTTQRARIFYATFGALVDDAITQGEASQAIPMEGEPIVLEHYEGTKASYPAVPTVFAGRWELKNGKKQEAGETISLIQSRITSPTVFELVTKARGQSLPLPPGVIDWLVNAPLESEATFETPTYKVVLNVTGR